jgi:hypothetical protein
MFKDVHGPPVCTSNLSRMYCRHRSRPISLNKSQPTWRHATLPRPVSISHLAPALIAMLLASIPRAQASDVALGKPASCNRHLIFTPTTLGFGKVAVRHKKFGMVTITNAGDSELTLLQVSTRGTGFAVMGSILP